MTIKIMPSTIPFIGLPMHPGKTSDIQETALEKIAKMGPIIAEFFITDAQMAQFPLAELKNLPTRLVQALFYNREKGISALPLHILNEIVTKLLPNQIAYITDAQFDGIDLDSLPDELIGELVRGKTRLPKLPPEKINRVFDALINLGYDLRLRCHLTKEQIEHLNETSKVIAQGWTKIPTECD